MVQGRAGVVWENEQWILQTFDFRGKVSSAIAFPSSQRASVCAMPAGSSVLLLLIHMHSHGRHTERTLSVGL